MNSEEILEENKEDLSCAGSADDSEILNFDNSRIKDDSDLSKFLHDVDDRVEDISTAYKEALWRMYVGEEAGDFSSLEERLLAITTSRHLLEFVTHWLPLTRDPVNRRRLTVWRHELEKTQVEFDHRIQTAYRHYLKQEEEFRHDVSGRSCSLDDLNRELTSERDRLLRAGYQRGLTDFSQKAAPLLMELFKARNESAINFGYANYADLCLSYLDVDWKAALAWFEEYRIASEEAFGKLRQDVIGELSLGSWSQSDLPFVSNTIYDPKWDTIVPFEQSAEGLLRHLAAMGADMDRLAISTREAPPGVSSLTIPISIPSDIRILISRADGFRHAALIAKEYGRALYYAGVDQNCYALRGVNEILLEASADVFASIPAQAEFWGSDSAMQESAKFFSRYVERNHLLEARIFMALAEFEVRMYVEWPEPDALWRELAARYLGFSVADADWGAQNVMVGRPFHTVQLALAGVIARRIDRRLQRTPLEERTKFLADKIYRYGNSLPWHQVVAGI